MKVVVKFIILMLIVASHVADDSDGNNDEMAVWLQCNR